AKLIRAVPLLAAAVCAACAPADGPPQPPEGAPVPAAAAPGASAEPIAAPADAPNVGRHDDPRRRIEAAVRNVRHRRRRRTNGFWTVFHGVLGVGPGLELLSPGLDVRVNALDCLCTDGRLRGQRFVPTPHGLEVVTLADGVGQGHPDQFAAEMAQWGLSPDR